MQPFTDLFRKLEVLANVVIIFSGLLLAGRYLEGKFSPTHSTPATIGVGTKFELAGSNPAKHGRTLVVALRQGCHFCAESTGFYQELTRIPAGSRDLHRTV